MVLNLRGLKGESSGFTIALRPPGARHIGIIQSLISTCKLQGINSHRYLTDVLHRVSEHPAGSAEELTPSVWENTIADNPIRSVLNRNINAASE